MIDIDTKTVEGIASLLDEAASNISAMMDTAKADELQVRHFLPDELHGSALMLRDAVKQPSVEAREASRAKFEEKVFCFRFIKSIKRTGQGGPFELVSQDCPPMAEFCRRHPEAPHLYQEPFVAGAWWQWCESFGYDVETPLPEDPDAL